MTNRNLTNWRDGNGTPPLFAPFSSYWREIDRLFDDILTPHEGRALRHNLLPNLEVRETDSAFIVTMELPGIEQKDIQVDLKDNVLTLAGEKREVHDQDRQGRQYSERSYGQFERRVSLDEDLDGGKIEAKFGNGILTVTLPKSSPSHKGRHIEVMS